MKLVVAGATGFVATEVIRQALSNPAITSVIALARRSTAVPKHTAPGADPGKLKAVVCDDFGTYSESVKGELAGADACIWLLAVTPTRSRAMSPDEVRKICLDYTVSGLKQMAQLRRGSAAKPLRFIYTSGSNAERDQTKKPWIHGNYSLMRGETESRVLNFAKQSNGAVEACIAKPGLIDPAEGPGIMKRVLQVVLYLAVGVPNIGVCVMAATLLNQACVGITQETLLNSDLAEIGQKALAEEKDQQTGS